MQITKVNWHTISPSNISINDGLWGQISFKNDWWERFMAWWGRSERGWGWQNQCQIQGEVILTDGLGNEKWKKEIAETVGFKDGERIQNLTLIEVDPATKQIPNARVGDKVIVRFYAQDRPFASHKMAVERTFTIYKQAMPDK